MVNVGLEYKAFRVNVGSGGGKGKEKQAQKSKWHLVTVFISQVMKQISLCVKRGGVMFQSLVNKY